MRWGTWRSHTSKNPVWVNLETRAGRGRKKTRAMLLIKFTFWQIHSSSSHARKSPVKWPSHSSKPIILSPGILHPNSHAADTDVSCIIWAKHSCFYYQKRGLQENYVTPRTPECVVTYSDWWHGGGYFSSRALRGITRSVTAHEASMQQMKAAPSALALQ